MLPPPVTESRSGCVCCGSLNLGTRGARRLGNHATRPRDLELTSRSDHGIDMRLELG